MTIADETTELGADALAPLLLTELPGPHARAVIARDEAVTSPSLTRVYPLVVRRGRGCVIEDLDGNRFLDFNAGIAVVAAGHAHPEVNAAIHAQVDDVLHYCSSDFYLPAYAEVCDRLAALAPMPDARVFLSNSGTEAVEAALKLARHHTGRPNVIAFFGAFHGRSLGSLSLTASKSRQRAGFGTLVPGSFHAPYADPYGGTAPTGAEYIEEVLFKTLTAPDDVAAVFVEPIQGEGGYVVPPPGWLSDLRTLCDAHGILLVADEVQSGVGRTGRMWATEHEGVIPDVMCVGKGLASGMPLAGIVARSEVMDWEPGGHGSTFGGNPVACAAAMRHARPGRTRAGSERGRRRRAPARRARRAGGAPGADRAGPRPRPDDRRRTPRPRHRRRPRTGLLRSWVARADLRRAVDPPRPSPRRDPWTSRHRRVDHGRRPDRDERRPGMSLPTTADLADRATMILSACGADSAKR